MSSSQPTTIDLSIKARANMRQSLGCEPKGSSWSTEDYIYVLEVNEDGQLCVMRYKKVSGETD